MWFIISPCKKRERAHPRIVLVLESLEKIHPFESVECRWREKEVGGRASFALSLLFAFFFPSRGKTPEAGIWFGSPRAMDFLPLSPFGIRW
jgi:hypothetical protein